jgi:hypothetical protein
MDNFIKKLKEEEEKAIVGGMALMAYNPSIGRVLEKRGVKKFQKMALKRTHNLKNISARAAFDKFHNR